MHPKHIKKTFSDRVFDFFNIILMIVLLIVFVWPLWFVIIASVSDPNAVNAGLVLVWPKGFTLEGFEKIMQYEQLWQGYLNSIIYTLVGTMLNMVMSICFAYPMSDKSFEIRKPLMIFFMISMYFGGGLIPSFLLMKNLHILNTPFVFVLSGAISIYN